MTVIFKCNLATISLCTFFILISGCGRMFLVSAIPAAKKSSEKIQERDDPNILEKSLPSTLITYEGFLGIAPDSRELLTMTSATYCLYALSFVEDIDKEDALALYKRGKELGMRALMLNHVFADAVKEGSLEKFESVLWVFRKRDVEVLYNTANNWLSLINLSNVSRRNVSDSAKAFALMNRALELDEEYNHGAIHAALGAHHCLHSKLKGDIFERAKHHFDKAFEISGSKFLLFYFLYAKTYAVGIKDKKLFVNTLTKVLESSADQIAEMNMANQIAKMKAERLLDEAENLFL